mmetsp:Transcript_31877/g.52662  ORF Transcript_31877/g.52662 Transcript_31877/m.52662 type:complete len:96 (-) Transcript_31877:139-426(-)
MEPIFAMYKTQRIKNNEAFGDFCHRITNPVIEEFMATYESGSFATMRDPFGPELVTTDATVGISSELLATVQAEATARGYDEATLIDLILREALE